ncbi:outer membrane lipoprotein carrier protein LolA [Rhizobium sp. SL42]|nr:outer membrane lipoprotein carrier protein LolA [Rhizobium sp. SL42]
MKPPPFFGKTCKHMKEYRMSEDNAEREVFMPALTSRRQFVLGAAAFMAYAALPPMPAFAATDAAQKIADHFSSVKNMMGEFVQFGPRGEQTGGKFFIQRPGKLRFNYEKPSPMRVIADGKNVVIGNTKLKTWDLYPLSKTPLSLLLAERIDLGNKMVRDVKEEADLTTIVLGDKTLLGDSTITLMFDPKTFELRQWTITDLQKKDTSVMIFNVQTGVDFDQSVFEIPYADVHNQQR